MGVTNIRGTKYEKHAKITEREKPSAKQEYFLLIYPKGDSCNTPAIIIYYLSAFI